MSFGYWTPERTKAFWEEMKICKGARADGKDGKCIDPDRHNLGCVNCPIGDGGLYEPEAINEN
jgi:hypothetical protein